MKSDLVTIIYIVTCDCTERTFRTYDKYIMQKIHTGIEPMNSNASKRNKISLIYTIHLNIYIYYRR